MLNLFKKLPIFEDYYMYQAPLTPEEEDEYVYNYLTEKRLGEEIQVGCSNGSIYFRRLKNSTNNRDRERNIDSIEDQRS